jgi:Ca2+-binding EF-hand superfamily protein
MSSFLKQSLVAVVVLGIGASSAMAAPAKGSKKKDADVTFKKLDANSDGKLTIEEMKGKGKREAAKVEKRFKKADKNGDGKVTLEEMKGGGKKKAKKKA